MGFQYELRYSECEGQGTRAWGKCPGVKTNVRVFLAMHTMTQCKSVEQFLMLSYFKRHTGPWFCWKYSAWAAPSSPQHRCIRKESSKPSLSQNSPSGRRRSFLLFCTESQFGIRERPRNTEYGFSEWAEKVIEALTASQHNGAGFDCVTSAPHSHEKG